MKIRNIYLLILINALRVYDNRIKEKTEQVFPEFKSVSKYFIYAYFIIQLALILLILSIDIQNANAVINLTSTYTFEIILVKFFIEVIFLTNIDKFVIPTNIQNVNGVHPSMFYMLVSNFRHFFSWIFLQVIVIKLFHFKTSLILLLMSSILLYGFLYAKLFRFKHLPLIFRLIFLSNVAAILIAAVSKFGNLYQTDVMEVLKETIGIATVFNLFLIFVSASICVTYLFRYVKTTNQRINKNHKIQYLKTMILPISIFLLLTITSQFFSLIGKIEGQLVLISFLLTSIIVKMKFINFLTIETYGYFAFYIKAMEADLHKSLLKNIERNNAIFLFPILLIHSLYFLMNQNIIFLIVLFSIYLLDLKTDELIMYITRKIVKKNELPNLFIHSKKGLASVLLLGFIPIPIITMMIKENVSSGFVLETNIIIILLLCCISLIVYYWKNSFFKDLYK